jgi:hypothetical protein
VEAGRVIGHVNAPASSAAVGASVAAGTRAVVNGGTVNAGSVNAGPVNAAVNATARSVSVVQGAVMLHEILAAGQVVQVSVPNSSQQFQIYARVNAPQINARVNAPQIVVRGIHIDGRSFEGIIRNNRLHIYGPRFTQPQIRVIVNNISTAITTATRQYYPGISFAYPIIPYSSVYIGDNVSFIPPVQRPTPAQAVVAPPPPAAVVAAPPPAPNGPAAAPAARATPSLSTATVRLNAGACGCDDTLRQRIETLEASEANRNGTVYVPPAPRFQAGVPYRFGAPVFPPTVSAPTLRTGLNDSTSLTRLSSAIFQRSSLAAMPRQTPPKAPKPPSAPAVAIANNTAANRKNPDLGSVHTPLIVDNKPPIFQARASDKLHTPSATDYAANPSQSGMSWAQAVRNTFSRLNPFKGLGDSEREHYARYANRAEPRLSIG